MGGNIRLSVHQRHGQAVSDLGHQVVITRYRRRRHTGTDMGEQIALTHQ